jgi:hypothetical protein
MDYQIVSYEISFRNYNYHHIIMIVIIQQSLGPMALPSTDLPRSLLLFVEHMYVDISKHSCPIRSRW